MFAIVVRAEKKKKGGGEWVIYNVLSLKNGLKVYAINLFTEVIYGKCLEQCLEQGNSE